MSCPPWCGQEIRAGEPAERKCHGCRDRKKRAALRLKRCAHGFSWCPTKRTCRGCTADEQRAQREATIKSVTKQGLMPAKEAARAWF